jgi:hypothetical protein
VPNLLIVAERLVSLDSSQHIATSAILEQHALYTSFIIEQRSYDADLVPMVMISSGAVVYNE